MKIINRIVEAQMTADEQVELMRLEDEVCQATDEYAFAQNEFINSSINLTQKYREVRLSGNALDITIDNLNKYIAQITKDVMECIRSVDAV